MEQAWVFCDSALGTQASTLQFGSTLGGLGGGFFCLFLLSRAVTGKELTEKRMIYQDSAVERESFSREELSKRMMENVLNFL